MATSGSDDASSNPHRKMLCIAIASVCQSKGFTGIDKDVLQTLAEMLQSLIIELGKTSLSYSELSGRTQPGIGDVVMALVDLGINVDSIGTFVKQHGNDHAMPNTLQPAVPTPRLLQAGEKKSHPNYIPEHFPSFPDPHTYIQTPTHKQPVTEYEAIREKAASQKKDVERALTRFIAKTGNTDSLFNDEATSNLFPCKYINVEIQPIMTGNVTVDQVDRYIYLGQLISIHRDWEPEVRRRVALVIATKSEPIPYLNALIPKDQVFEEEEPPVIEKKPPKRIKKAEDDVVILESEESPKTETSENEVIDNPFVRPCKIPRNLEADDIHALHSRCTQIKERAKIVKSQIRENIMAQRNILSYFQKKRLATNVSVEEPPKDSHVEIDPEREEIENSERNVDIVEDESLDKNGDSPWGEKRKRVDSGESEPEIERGDEGQKFISIIKLLYCVVIINDNEKDSCLPVVLCATALIFMNLMFTS
ncbi:Transcription initiation factor TFIID subunit 8 [Nymphon striatum]|nr:Transcription initiation factor TFIID subunit 8 [Nymphon striatum]